MVPMSDIFRKHGTDKGTLHNYGSVYDMLFPDRSAIKSVLEIGVDQGYSLNAWEEAFPNAQIYGIDIVHKGIERDRVHTVQLDAGNPVALRVWASTQQFDLIVDDGSHRIRDILMSMFVLLPHLHPNGFYVVEEPAMWEGGFVEWERCFKRMFSGKWIETESANGTESGMFVI